jgi:hypothetical protein
MKKIITSFVLILINCSTFAQKANTSAGINAGTTIPLSESSFYKPSLHAGAIFGYGVRQEKNDALTLGAGYHTFVNKRFTNDVVKMVDIKIGLRFFPSAKTPIYIHPNIGTGFFADGRGGKAGVAAGIAIGFLPKVGKANINVFAAYNKMSFSQGVSLLNLGVGYQFNFKGK